MKKLLSIFAAFGLTASASATVVACGEDSDPFSGSSEANSSEATKALGEENLYEFNIFMAETGNQNFAKKWINYAAKLLEAIENPEFDILIKLTSSDVEVVETSVQERVGAFFELKKAGTTTLEYESTISKDDKIVVKLKWTLKLTVTGSVFLFNF